jgi:hypothetical protein
MQLEGVYYSVDDAACQAGAMGFFFYEIPGQVILHCFGLGRAMREGDTPMASPAIHVPAIAGQALFAWQTIVTNIVEWAMSAWPGVVNDILCKVGSVRSRRGFGFVPSYGNKGLTKSC